MNRLFFCGWRIGLGNVVIPGHAVNSNIQLATAIVRKSDFFLSNDAALKQVKEIKVIVLEDHLPRP
ncbi:MAG: hypothetical protein IBX46_07045 [Desulfuromonadales bacterium]|nr:hypothetical protein [Desulfuromonadales bacterium]